MANAVLVTVTYDAGGGLSFAVKFHVASTVVDPTTEPIPTIIAKINALTNGKPLRVELSIIKSTSATVTSVVSYVNEDKAFARFVDDGGNPHNYRIPGLDPTVLGSSTESIANTGAFSVYVDAVQTNALTSNGNTIPTFVKAYRKENRKKLKR